MQGELNYDFKLEESIQYIKKKIIKARKKNRKIRLFGANFGIDLYDNELYQDNLNNVKYISLKEYEFKPFMTKNNTLICHPNNTLRRCFKIASRSDRMIYGTPFFYEISIGGAICNGAIGGHIFSTNVPSHVVKLWIVNGNGEEKVIEGNDLNYFRSTFGYLGVIYQIELNTYPQQYFKIHKINSEHPFKHNNHVTQLVLHDHSIGVQDDVATSHVDDGKEYIDITLEPVDKPSDQVLNNMKNKILLNNIKKNIVFMVDGMISTVYKSIITGFFDIFIPANNLITNSYGLVKAFPILPNLALKSIPIPLEAGIYVEPKYLTLVLYMILKHYKEWYNSAYCCINVVIRKVKTNNNCFLDMTYKIGDVDEVICFDFGFYGTKFHKHILDRAIKELLPYAYGFHLGKYINGDIITFARNKFHAIDKDEKMLEMKNKYDQDKIFSTTYLDFIFLQ